MVDVVFDCMGRNVKLFFDISIAHSIEDKLDDLSLTIGYFINSEEIIRVVPLGSRVVVFDRIFSQGKDQKKHGRKIHGKEGKNHDNTCVGQKIGKQEAGCNE
jgi:hypothetical protein